uniref:Uncharacterized protein n=1 Tax=Arundo donax TaxID=35708 RepID=A0A0A8XYZ8_ARUDO
MEKCWSPPPYECKLFLNVTKQNKKKTNYRYQMTIWLI